MLELYTQKDMGEEKSKIWLDRSLMSPSYHAEHIMLRYMDASTMQKLNTHHWRLSANQTPTGNLTLVRNADGALLLLVGLHALHVGLVHLLVADAIGHPVAAGDVEEQIDQRDAERGNLLEGVASLRVRERRRSHVAGVGEKSGEKVEHSDGEENRGREEAAVDLLGDAHEGDAGSEGRRERLQDAHRKGDRDDDDVAGAQRAVHAEDEIAGSEAESTTVQGNARGDGAHAEDEGQGQVHGGPLVAAAAGLLRVLVAFL